MITRRLQSVAGGLVAAVLAGLLMLGSDVRAQDKSKVEPDKSKVAPDQSKLELDKIPKQVMAGLKAKFPKAEIHKWTQEKEGDIVIYDIEFKQGERKFEADIKEDGTIHNWEREVAAKDLPKVVQKAADMKYPKATLKQIMLITLVKEKTEAPEGYEIVLETADKKEVEIMVAPEGKILEDTGAPTEEKKK